MHCTVFVLFHLGELAAKKFQHLKDRWRRLKKIYDGAKKSGAGASDIPKVTWRFFAVMDSLMAKERLGTSVNRAFQRPVCSSRIANLRFTVLDRHAFSINATLSLWLCDNRVTGAVIFAGSFQICTLSQIVLTCK